MVGVIQKADAVACVFRMAFALTLRVWKEYCPDTPCPEGRCCGVYRPEGRYCILCCKDYIYLNTQRLEGITP